MTADDDAVERSWLDGIDADIARLDGYESSRLQLLRRRLADHDALAAELARLKADLAALPDRMDTWNGHGLEPQAWASKIRAVLAVSPDHDHDDAIYCSTTCPVWKKQGLEAPDQARSPLGRGSLTRLAKLVRYHGQCTHISAKESAEMVTLADALIAECEAAS